MKKKRRGVREPDARAVAEAERIHADLGLEQPEDIDILLIAAHLGVVAVARTLTNEQGHVLRSHGRALAAIDRAKLRTNEWRFILALETGHTLLDGAHDDFARCTLEAPTSARRAIESAANDFAAELLMPRAMLLPRAVAWFAHGRDFDAVDVRWRKGVPNESAATRATVETVTHANVAARAWSSDADPDVMITEEASVTAEGGTVIWMRDGIGS